jgi:hypothetical protein
MKTLKFTILLTFLVLVSDANAQKVFKPASIIDGKTILQLARECDVQVYLSTAPVYKAGMSESTFVSTILSNFPNEANGYKEICTPYLKYIYTFHIKGLSETQARSSVTGSELADLTTELSLWNARNSGQISDSFKSRWRVILTEFKIFLMLILPAL